jgi:hypothetical protein
MHWILLGISAVAFSAAFFGSSQAAIGVGMLVGFVCLFGGFFLMISTRIAERSRPDSMLLTDADVNALRKSVREARDARDAAKGSQPSDSGS